ncbi:Peptidoglycan/LPS O-acetylase OafA/YrhL, contains acyltransferase and SGNH-hydrolase domains [Insolitispirillum peregrinum]|uniref:Peptidoglycan/LPS O-acetylase OafA/YrhL, contains acyltransferase and SGNH-hydrolase domains n=2 Tax=Insolitispirillum peregrinum TaxID=80876 RepID=A0A1N7MTF1_9PROT|nr:Peptidoglycan/LPS O-acetylase OafA/YrhL, contains acyltransferase and SGNH-hydrolase domains [Insolitispirillum peregrinum]
MVSEIKEGRFSIVKFYERRLRRLYPALFVTLMVTSIFCAMILTPDDFLYFSKALLSATLFLSNVFFYITTGYWATPASSNILLHIWSLSIEEQFYIFFPLFLLLGMRLKRGGYLKIMLVIFFFISLFLNQWAAADHLAAAFFLLPARAWELLLGAILALGVLPVSSRKIWHEGAGLLGGGMILTSIFLYTDVANSLGFTMLVPCLGAALVIYAGMAPTGPTFVSRMIGVSPLVMIGRISYSLYLFHWPIITLWTYRLDRPTNNMDIFLWIISSLVLSYFSWRFIETPFRKSVYFSRRIIFVSALVGAMVLTLFGLFGVTSNGWPARYPELALKFWSAAPVNPRPQCMASKAMVTGNQYCTYGSQTVAPTWALWGDSHSERLVGLLDEMASSRGIALTYFGHGGCPPFGGIGNIGQPTCYQHNQQALGDILASKTIKNVILSGYYSLYLEGRFDLLDQSKAVDVLTDQRRQLLSREKMIEVYGNAVRSTVSSLIAAGIHVHLVYPVPDTGFDVPKAMVRHLMAGQDPFALTVPFEQYKKRNQVIMQIFDELPDSPLLSRIYPASVLCDSQSCRTSDGQVPLYHDSNHLSADGARLLVPLLHFE